MTATNYMGPAVLDVALGPARAAYLIAEGSRTGYQRAVQEASTRWGGVCEPIIPIGPGGMITDLWRQVVDLSGVEAAVNVDVPAADATVAAQALGLELVPLTQIDEWGSPLLWTCHPSHVGSRPDRYQLDVMASSKSSLWQVTAAGDLSDEHLASLGETPQSMRRPRTGDEVGRAQLSRTTLLDRTTAYFGEYHISGGPWPCPALLWVTDGDDLTDCLWFWNARALRPLRLETIPMLLLPLDDVQYWLKFPDQFSAILARPEGFSPDVVIDSQTANENQLGEMAALLGLRESTERVRAGRRMPETRRQPPFTYRTGEDLRRSGIHYWRWLVFQRKYGETTRVDTQLFGTQTNVRFVSPVTFTGAGFALVRLSGAPLDALPKRAEVATLVEKSAKWQDGSIQLNCPATYDYHLQINIPSLQQAIDAILARTTVTHRLSDKGRMGSALLSNTEIAVLLQPGVYEAVIQLTTPRAKRLRQELQFLQEDGVALDDTVVERLVAEWGHRGDRRYRSVAQMQGLGPAAANVLETLCGLEWAERGFEIACSSCGISSFVPIAEVSGRGTATCAGCRSEQRYVLTGAGPKAVYRLDAFVDRASDQGVIPHLLAVAALMKQDKQSAFLPGVDVVFGDGEKKEIDIFGSYGGRVLAGEVKSQAAEFDYEQLMGDIDKSKRLAVEAHVLAVVEEIPEATAETVSELCARAELDLIILGKSELRPDS